MSRGQKNSPEKFACQNDAVLSLLPAGESTSVRLKGNPYLFTWFYSRLPASLRGGQGIRWGSFLPPDFGPPQADEFFRPLDNKKGFPHPDLNFFTASVNGGEGRGEGEG